MDYYHSKTPKENKKKHVKFATFFQLIFFVSDKPISPNRGVSTSPFTRRGVQNAVTYVLKYVEIYINKRLFTTSRQNKLKKFRNNRPSHGMTLFIKIDALKRFLLSSS